MDQIDALKSENQELEQALNAASNEGSPTNDQVKKRWDGFAELYTKNLSIWSEQSTQTLLSNLRLGEAKALVECACGPGHMLHRVREKLTPGARYVATDFSDEMVKIAKAVTPAVDAELLACDAQELPEEWTGKFDRYLANLCLMIVPDPVKCLASASRVLEPNGLAAFSIWGTKSKSHMFGLMKEVMDAEGIENPVAPPIVRSNFHLGQDDTALKRMFQKAGFGSILIWHQMCSLAFLDGHEFCDFWLGVNPTNVKMCQAMPPADLARLKAAFSAAAQKILDAGDPIGLDTIIIVARKQ